MFAVLSAARKPFARLALLFSILLVAACEPMPMTVGGGVSAPSVARGEAVAVALLVPKGAPSGQERELARDLENAARMAVADMQGARIDLRVYDTAGNAGAARAAGLKAVAEGAKIIVGPLHAESANAVAVAVADKGVNVLTFSNNASIAGGNLFVLGQTFENTADRLARFSVRNGKRNILTVYSENLAGQQGRQAIQRAVSASGGTNAGSVGYQFSQAGVVNAVPRITSTASSSGADAIFLTANAAGALPLLTQMLPEAGLTPGQMQYIGLSRWDSPAQTLALPGVQGGWFAMPDPNRSAQFESRYRSAYGGTPHALSGLAYDGIAAVGALAKSRGGALSRGALTQRAGFQGVNGVFRFRQDGTNERGLAVATIRSNQVVVVEQAPQGFRGAGF